MQIKDKTWYIPKNKQQNEPRNADNTQTKQQKNQSVTMNYT